MKKENIKYALFVTLITIFIFSISCQQNTPTETQPEPYICFDVHSQPPYPELGDMVNLSSILQDMEENNVSLSILSARGDMKYSNDIAAFAAANPNRIIAAASLKLNCMNSDTGFINTLEQQIATGGFQAVAEILLYHAEKFSNGISVAPEFMIDINDPKLQAVVSTCMQLNCPVFLHIEFQSLENNYGTALRTEYMNKLKQLLSNNQNIPFILMHVAELDPSDCRNLIDNYSNVYFSTMFRDLSRLMTGELVENFSESEWNTLFEDQADRFIFAFDRVFAQQWDLYETDMDYVQEKLANLSENTARAIASENAKRLFGL